MTAPLPDAYLLQHLFDIFFRVRNILKNSWELPVSYLIPGTFSSEWVWGWTQKLTNYTKPVLATSLSTFGKLIRPTIKDGWGWSRVYWWHSGGPVMCKLFAKEWRNSWVILPGAPREFWEGGPKGVNRWFAVSFFISQLIPEVGEVRGVNEYFMTLICEMEFVLFEILSVVLP